jgi:quercetin dioxygenase-like cupin family protein
VASQTSFVVRRVAVAPGRSRPYDAAEWTDALVVVARGRIELEGLSGARRTFVAGAALWLDGLALRALHNHGPEPAVMVGFARLR